ncbi:MAG TPA: class I SAM-dependent methyltransferase [Vicinamibacterales bacterium]|nr:class I SAM-dependent methyltransferase [Vicinamibacterales bacterium]
MTEGWRGWDVYAPFYDWENARTLQRRDVAFWRRLAAAQDGPVLELGCGTGRIAVPVARAGARIVGIDRSQEMLARARTRIVRTGLRGRLTLVRGDIRDLPFTRRTKFSAVLAAYGILQSLTRERDLTRTLAAVARVLRQGGLFAIDVVPDLPKWDEYRNRISLSGRHGRHSTLTLVETVRQDRAKRLTIFDQEYRERRGDQRRVHRFSLTFRTLTVPQMRRRLERAGFKVLAVLGDYQGGPWDPRADVWIILAAKR